MSPFLIVIIALLLLCLINYGIDFAFYLKNRYCRYHIGRWEESTWQEAVENISIKWLKRTPVVKITDNSRYMLLDFVTGKYKSHTIQSWQKASLILGTLQSDKSESNDAAKRAAQDLLDNKGSWKEPPIAVDCGMLSFAVLLASDDCDKIRPAMDYSISIIEKNINDNGMISYTGGKSGTAMYVDTIGLTCPFLTLYSYRYGDKKWETVAFNQLKLFHQYGLYQDTALPNHAFHNTTKLPLGVYGWGRGVGWYIIGLTDTYEFIQDTKYKEAIRGWIADAADYYKAFQQADGGFNAIIQRDGIYDSSATAVLAWFYLRVSDILEKPEYKAIADRCLQKLRKVTRITGAIDWCQGDTKDIGVFAQTYDLMPFAQGMTLRALDLRNSQKDS